jgi:hypothetical protein
MHIYIYIYMYIYTSISVGVILNESKNPSTELLDEEILFSILKKSIKNMDNNLLAPFMYVDSLRLLIHSVMKGSVAMIRFVHVYLSVCIYVYIYIYLFTVL